MGLNQAFFLPPLRGMVDYFPNASGSRLKGRRELLLLCFLSRFAAPSLLLLNMLVLSPSLIARREPLKLLVTQPHTGAANICQAGPKTHLFPPKPLQ